jgi:integrase
MIQRRGNSWRARYHGPDGRERSKSFARKADAERWLAQQRTLISQDDWTDPAFGRITFGEYVLAWLGARIDLKPKTRHQYQSLLGLHILPTWGTVPLGKITFEGLSQWAARLHLGGLGPSGVRQSVFVMSAALDHAVRSNRIRSNPARGLGLPRPRHRDYVFLTHGELRGLADETGPWRAFVLVLGYTGLRWGEATALRACDIDLAAAASTCTGRSPTSAAMSSSAPRNRTSPARSRSRHSWPTSWRRPSTAGSLTTSRSPCPAAATCGCPTGGGQRSCPPALEPGSANGSGFTTCGTPPRP